MEFKHYILTRFSLGNDLSYVEKRMRWFEDFYLSSIEGQTCQDFEVWLLVSPGMASPLKYQYYDLLPGNVRIVEIFCQGLQPDTGDLARILKNDANPDTTHILTTRIDSDDAIAKDFVSRVQEAARSHLTTAAHNQEVVFDFPQGCLWYEGEFYGINYPSNMFVSILSTLGNMKHCHTVQHTSMTQHFAVRNLCTGLFARWIHVVHPGAVTYSKSVLKKYPEALPKITLGIKEHFTLPEPLLP